MYGEKDFSSLIGMEGFSEDLLKDHFKLYKGYVANTNKVAKLLKHANRTTYDYGELKRRFGWEFNGMRFHELFFENMIQGGKPVGSKAKEAIEKEFGTFEEWQCDFMANASMRGIGWVVLTYDPVAKRIFNIWVNEHDVGFLAGSIPLLVLDVFEHAFIRDYGLNKKDYIAAFIKNINWEIVEGRLK